MDWHSYWNTVPPTIGAYDYLKQVGRTTNGMSVPEENILLIVKDIVSKLDLKSSDKVLDLCCGNAVITAMLSCYCEHITGIDFSEHLIRIAIQSFGLPNTTYQLADVRQLPDELCKTPFTKIMMNFSVQYLGKEELLQLLKVLRQTASFRSPIFFSSIPDRARLWEFYNTTERRAEYQRRLQDGTEAIGTWWYQSEFQELAISCGYEPEFFKQSPTLDTAHYRFDAVLLPTAQGYSTTD